MDATTELPKEKAVKTKQTPKTRKKPTANEMKSDGTNVPKLNLEQAKKASDHNAIDLQELLPNPWFTSKDGMRKAKLNIQQKQDQENQDKYDANLIDKSIKKSMKEDVDYQLSRKDNQGIAKMMKKVKNSFSSSPVAALVVYLI